MSKQQEEKKSTRPKRSRKPKNQTMLDYVKDKELSGVPLSVKSKMRRGKRRFGESPNTDMILHASGARGVDTRVASREVKLVGTSSIAMVQQDPVLDVTVRITQRSLAYTAAGIVLRAISRGWLASAASKGAHPYYAFRYLIDSLKNSINGTFPTLQSAPQWFWELNAALLPKTEPFKTGRISYNGFNLDDGAGVDPLFTLGTGDYDYSIYWGLAAVGPTAPSINGYLELVPPLAYTAEAGQESVQAMFQFFEEKGMCRRSGAPDPSSLWMTHDTSAFAAVYPELGASYFNPCGSATTVQSERVITSPIFAKFGSYQDGSGGAGGTMWRGWHAYHRSAGTPFYLGPRLTEMFHPRQMRNKVAPIFKWFNFDQFFEVLSLSLCLALESAQKASVPLGPCPLTSQQVQIMLRQAMLPFFCNEMAQDLRLESNAWYPLLPFVVGPNGVAQGTGGPGPMLPRFLAENIRNVKRIVAKLPNKNSAYSNMELDILPILARPSPAVRPQLANYAFGVGPTFLYKQDNTEVPINLIDASAPKDEATAYLDLNGTAYTLCVKTWNDWIKAYEGGLTGLVNLSNDRGCLALSVLPYTNFQQVLEVDDEPEPPPQQGGGALGKRLSKEVQATTATTETASPSHSKSKNGKRASVRVRGLNLSSLRTQVTAGPTVGSQEFQQMVLIQTSASMGFTSELWKYLSNWVLPVAITIVPNEQSDMVSYQSNVIEPFTMPSSSSFTGTLALDTTQEQYPTVYDKNYNFAVQNTRSWNSPVKSEMEEEFQALTVKGDGGFFTKIAGIIGESIGISGSAQFMDSVGAITGL